LFRHLLNYTPQECEDRASDLEPLVSQRLQNATELQALAEAAENWQVLEVVQQPRQAIPRTAAFQTFSEEENYKVGRHIFMQAKYSFLPPIWSCSVPK